MEESFRTRRAFLIDGAGVLAAGALGGRLTGGYRSARRTAGITEPRATELAALRALGRSAMRLPDSLPHPELAAGTDTMPEIEHVVVLMLENHSYDNFLGMLGRGPGQVPRGDGFTLGRDGYPTATNPYADGRLQRAFRMPTTCQLHGKPSQEWKQSHVQYANGTNQGFVISDSGPVAMGYWTEHDIPFTYGLAKNFPIGDRWFCSLLGQTDPNRRFLIAGTCTGMTDDIGTGAGSVLPDVSLALPSNGTIFERLDAAHVSWVDYYESFPTGATVELYPVLDTASALVHTKNFSQFFVDARAGKLPAFTLLDPDYGRQSQENPQNIVVGEALLAQVVHALADGPGWLKTLLILVYDEHGGYYDHVPPPRALKPDIIPPFVRPGQSTYDGFARYGFRVPAMVIGPYAKRDHVSHILYDHTSILAFLERKWNLPAMTYRDANANDLTDFLDLKAMAARRPTFPELPKLPAPGDTQAALACSRTGPGAIPPPSARPIALQIEIRNLGVSRRRRGLELELWTTRSTLTDLVVELHEGPRRVARTRIRELSEPPRHVVLRDRGRAPAAGRYTVIVRHGRRVLLRRAVRVR
jgi:phospholipase C